MFEQSGNAVFSKNGVTLSIPQGAFPYTDADTVTVSITPKEDGNYAVQVTVNDENVSLQKEVTLWFPESLFSKDAEPALEVNGAAQQTATLTAWIPVIWESSPFRQQRQSIMLRTGFSGWQAESLRQDWASFCSCG